MNIVIPPPDESPFKKSPPDCRFGHGPMVWSPGGFALIGQDIPGFAPWKPLPMLTNRDVYFTVRVAHCLQCGAIELFDSDKVS